MKEKQRVLSMYYNLQKATKLQSFKVYTTHQNQHPDRKSDRTYLDAESMLSFLLFKTTIRFSSGPNVADISEKPVH